MDTGPQSDPVVAEPLEDPFKRREAEPHVPAPPARRREPVAVP